MSLRSSFLSISWFVGAFLLVMGVGLVVSIQDTYATASSINLTDFSSSGPFVGFHSLHDSHIAYSRV